MDKLFDEESAKSYGFKVVQNVEKHMKRSMWGIFKRPILVYSSYDIMKWNGASWEKMPIEVIYG